MTAKTKHTPAKVTLWQMLRDVLIASMNKGQFLVALSFLLVVIIILKMPSQDVSRLAFEVVQKLENGRLLGYFLSILLSGGWYAHAKYQRRSIAGEQDRLANERNEWQNRALEGGIKSSGTRRKVRGKKV
jgi:hypothetical protein